MERPILFNGTMVQAILAGQKTQTRRVMKPQARCTVPRDCAVCNEWRLDGQTSYSCPTTCVTTPAPPCNPGDILWVRETWQHVYNFDECDQPVEGTGRYIYFADNPMPFDYWVDADTGEHKERMPWKPAIHMPKEAARIFLRVKDVRVERLREITSDDCKREGIWDDYKTPTEEYHEALVKVAYPKIFGELWDSTIKSSDRDMYGWKANPWVWVIEFERCEKPEGWCGA